MIFCEWETSIRGLFLRPIRKGPHELVVAEGPQVG
jgi:hypothetical protein